MIHVAFAIAAALNVLAILLLGPEKTPFNAFSLGFILGLWFAHCVQSR